MDQTAESTLQRRAGSDGLAPAIASHLRREADAAEAALGGDAARHVEALRTFAQYVEARPVEDSRIASLHVLGGVLGWGGTDYAPGERQSQLFGLLGTGRPAPLPSATLDELVGVAIEDALAAAGVKAEQADRERGLALAETEVAREAAEAAQRAIEERDGLSVEVAELRAEIASKAAQLAHLQSMIAPTPEPSGPPRRKRLPGHEGIYFKQSDAGKVYEITWREDGRRRWKTVGTDLQAALALREEITQPERAAA